MSLDLQTRQGYVVNVVQIDDSNLVMTVTVTNPDGKASGRHIFNLKTAPGAVLRLKMWRPEALPSGLVTVTVITRFESSI